MQHEAFRLGLMFIGLGFVMGVVSVPLYLRKVPPNAWYGVRIPTAFRSERNWYEINHYGAKLLFVNAAITAAIGLALSFSSGLSDAIILALLLAPVALFLPLLVAVVRFSRRLPDAGA